MKGLFLWDRFRSIGILTLVDLKHLAGLTTLWEYRDLLSVGMGIFRFERNWAFMTKFLYRVRMEEEETLGSVYTPRELTFLCAAAFFVNSVSCPPAILKAGIYRDKYRSLNDTLWRTKSRKPIKMVDLDSDSDTEKTPDSAKDIVPSSSSAGKEAPPKEVTLARAANLLNLPRFR